MAIRRGAVVSTSFGSQSERQVRTEPSPVFILGAPRSGTSLLYRCLALHPAAAWPSNYLRRAPAVPVLAALNRVAAAAPATRSRVWFGSAGDNAYRYAAHRSLGERVFPQPVEAEPLYRRRGLPGQSESREPTAGQLLLRKDFQRLMRYSGGSVVISKRIANNTRVPLLRSIFPAARFIDLRRDGRAVAASLLDVDWWKREPLWWCGVTPGNAAGRGQDVVLLAAQHWVREVEAIGTGLAGTPQDQVLQLEYEAMVVDPLGTLQRAASFCGLGADERWHEALSRLRFPNHNDAWIGTLGDRAADVTRVQAVPLAALGYLDSP